MMYSEYRDNRTYTINTDCVPFDTREYHLSLFNIWYNKDARAL